MDRDLQEAFRRLRASDDACRPGFDALTGRPTPPARPIPVLRGALAFGLGAVLAGAAFFAARALAPKRVPEDLVAWRSPTRSLLPAGDGAIPRLGETWGASVPRQQEEPR